MESLLGIVHKISVPLPWKRFSKSPHPFGNWSPSPKKLQSLVSREYGYFLEKIKLKHLIQAIKDECINLKRMLASPVIIIKNGKGRSRSLKWGVNFCNNVREIKYYFNIWGIRKKKERRGSEKGGWKFTHFTSPGSAPEWVYQIRIQHWIIIFV